MATVPEKYNVTIIISDAEHPDRSLSTTLEDEPRDLILRDLDYGRGWIAYWVTQFEKYATPELGNPE